MILRRALKRVRPTLRADIAALLRLGIAHRGSRRLLNWIYDALSWNQQHFLQFEYRELFLHHPRCTPGCWNVTFVGRRVAFPLTAPRSALDWDMAISALGHDVQVKRTYDALLRGPNRPRVFFDVGANYGLHSLLFLTHGVRVVSFEPNATCHAYLKEACALNEFTPDIREVAVLDTEGVADFWFPESTTWMGTTDPNVQLTTQGPVKHLIVPTTTLDAFIAAHGCVPDLIKIDAEGSELRIINGSRHTLVTYRPLVIFESWPDGSREALEAAFSAAAYRIVALPYGPQENPRALTSEKFRASSDTNFIALPDR